MKEQFLKKIAAEYEAYKNSVLNISASDIYARAYEIDIMTNISGILINMAEKLSEYDLTLLSLHPNLLQELYNHWLKKEDGMYTEIENHITEEIEFIKRNSTDFGGKNGTDKIAEA